MLYKSAILFLLGATPLMAMPTDISPALEVLEERNATLAQICGSKEKRASGCGKVAEHIYRGTCFDHGGTAQAICGVFSCGSPYCYPCANVIRCTGGQGHSCTVDIPGNGEPPRPGRATC